jgi:oxygen-independent coproporphyrinogen III oxidase
MNADAAPPDLKDLLCGLNVSGPRYTSFPCVDRFVEAFGADEYRQALAQRRSGPTATVRPMSLYVHIPFCETLCYFCACNKVVTRQHGHAGPYLNYLSREVELHTAALGVGQPVSQLYVGGGTPTFMNDAELRDLMSMLRRNFKLIAGGEYAIEVDPRTVDATRLDTLAELGFNRLSIGIQDFDPAVQKAVHRIQPAEQVVELFQEARQRRFDSLSVDLIYGLPQQSPESFDRSLSEVIELRPDRIALYAYAHQPERYKPQRHISTVALPSDAAKVIMQTNSMASLIGAGYAHLGLDHFALPTDALAIAKWQGRLHRSFQGYSTQPDCDLIGLGVSAMGRIGATYSQNATTLAEYSDRLDQGLFPVVRGIALTRDDLVRRAIIMALMCQGEVSFESIELGYLIDFKHYFASEMESLQVYAEQNVVTIDDAGIQITEPGWRFVRAVAMVFDRYVQTDRTRAQFSKII